MRAKQQQILDEALKLVPFQGWTRQTMCDASNNAGLGSSYMDIAFPGGVDELIDLFIQKLDKQMLKKLDKKDLKKLRIKDRIKFAIEARLEAAEPYKQSIRRTVNYYASPFNAISAAPVVMKTADKILKAIGDDSKKFDHCAKQTVIAGLYSATLLYWLNDYSDKHTDTFDFLSRRINNVISLQGLKDKFTKRCN